MTLNASDNVSIKADRLLVDGTPREQRARVCNSLHLESGVSGCGWSTPPGNEDPSVVFGEQAADDPARLRVAASDATPGLRTVTIAARRRGDNAWTELPVHANGGSDSAFLDDEALPPAPTTCGRVPSTWPATSG